MHTLIRSDRRTLALQVTEDARVVVRAPRRLPLSFIDAFVRRHAGWIERQERRIREKKAASPPKRFVEGENFLFLGKAYPLEVRTGARSFVAFDGRRFLVPPADASEIRRWFVRWYSKQARTLLAERVGRVCAVHGLRAGRLRITGARRRWGSCSGKGDLSFSWRLALTPPEAVDYVVAHELAHLTHRDHSPKFWARVGTLEPAFRSARSWLRRHAPSVEF